MRNLIDDLKRNHTVLISSHNMTEISQTCDRLLVLGAGRLLGAGTVAELVGNKTDIRNITVTVKFPSAEANPHPRLQSVLATIDGVTEVGSYQHADGHTFALSTSRDCRAEKSAVVDAKLDLLKLDYTRAVNSRIRLCEWWAPPPTEATMHGTKAIFFRELGAYV